MSKAFIRDTPAEDGTHDNIKFNEFRSSEYWTAFWSRRMRRAFVLEKLAPYLLVLGIVVAFLFIGYMESAL